MAEYGAKLLPILSNVQRLVERRRFKRIEMGDIER